MSILRRTAPTITRERARTRRAIARALSTSPTQATRQELRALEARL